MNGIQCAFVCTLTTTPELKQGKTGKAYCNFSATVSGETGESWINTICFGSVAEELVQRAKKGDSVYVEGSLKLAEWENADGEKRSGLAVSATKVQRLGLNRANVPDENFGTFPIAFPAVKKKRPLVRLFRKPKKEAAPEVLHERPFDDELSF